MLVGRCPKTRSPVLNVDLHIDSLAKEGTTKEQVDRSTSYPELKTILKARQHSKVEAQAPTVQQG